MNIRKVYIGESELFNFEPKEVKYFYYENWNNASVKFQYVIEGKSMSTLALN